MVILSMMGILVMDVIYKSTYNRNPYDWLIFSVVPKNIKELGQNSDFESYDGFTTNCTHFFHASRLVSKHRCSALWDKHAGQIINSLMSPTEVELYPTYFRSRWSKISDSGMASQMPMARIDARIIWLVLDCQNEGKLYIFLFGACLL